MRKFNSDRNGNNFSISTIQAVWLKGQIIPGYNSNLWRRDACGAVIYRLHYGNIYSRFGWEVDHVKPVAKWGSDLLLNLQPLQWQNNRKKSDNLVWFCAVNY